MCCITCDLGEILPKGLATYGWIDILTAYLGALVWRVLIPILLLLLLLLLLQLSFSFFFIFVSSHCCFVSSHVTSADLWGLPELGGLEGGPGRKYVAYIFIFSQSAVAPGARKKFSLGPEPTVGGPACYSLPKSCFGSCRSFLFFAIGYQIKDELHGIRSTHDKRLEMPRIFKLL